MKTILNCSDLFRFERLVSKLVKSSEIPATVSFAPCSDGLQFVTFTDTAVLTLTVPSSDVVEPFTLPWSTIKELASKKNENIDLDVRVDSVGLSWNVNSIPQQKTVPSRGLTDKRLPSKPENMISHPLTLFDALTDAAKCVDSDNTRYSLGSICLRGSKAQIVSTDGRQALIQDGFSFPWENDVLCPVTKIFGSKELCECSDAVKIGVDGGWIMFEVGVVKFWLKQIEGKFPQLDQFTKNNDHFTWLNVDSDDANFVAQRLDDLPGKTDREMPVYVELNGNVFVRGYDQVRRTATELHLTRSRYEGKELSMPMNRRFLKNALGFGINRLGFDPDERTPVVCYGNDKTFIIMPLEGDEPKVDMSKVTVLPSDVKISVAQKIGKSIKPKINAPVATVAARRVRPTAKPSHLSNEQMDVIAASEGLCQTLADTLQVTRRLVRNLKEQRKQNRLMRATIASLKQLQNV